jgi:neutral ceramidase
MGYASPTPLTSGIHTRLYSRAFVIDDTINRVVFVSVDVCMIDQSVKTEVYYSIVMFRKLRVCYAVWWFTCVKTKWLAGKMFSTRK